MCKCSRKFSGSEAISSDELLNMTKQRRISEEVKSKRWNWIRYVFRMDENSNCVIAMTWIPEGTRKGIQETRLEGYLGNRPSMLPETEETGRSALQPYGLLYSPEEDR